MNLPLFVAVQGQLVNLSACEHIVAEDTTLTFTTPNDSYEFEFDSETQTQAALSTLQELLSSKNLCVGTLR
jgi:hypothetical protein